MHDAFGRQIEEFNLVVYAVRDGDQAALRRGIVVGVDDDKLRVNAETVFRGNWGPLSRTVTLKHSDRIVVVPDDWF